MAITVDVRTDEFSTPLSDMELAFIAQYKHDIVMPLFEINELYNEAELFIELYKQGNKCFVTLHLGNDCNNILLRCIDYDMGTALGKFIYRCLSPKVQKHIVSMIRHEPNQGTWCYGLSVTLDDCIEMLQNGK